MYPFFYDSTMIILIPAIILAMYAQSKVKSTYAKYVRIPSKKGYTGADAARAILDKNGLSDVNIQHIGGVLSDHYDPRTRVLRLSDQVYRGTSIASSAIAAHEVGHAIQHAKSYAPLIFRNAIVPVVNFASNLSWFFIMAGLIFAGMQSLLDIGIILFTGAVIFQIVTLPVEFNASSRALSELESVGVLTREEIPQSKKVLNAAALTYVAATATAVAQLIRLLLIRDRRR
ncbi:Zn-dependent membrane protease YugP [Acetoanaerobium pronyense]|uniref:Zn-dependent membrane protease YugP n=1 Tax=Acetoanaerobium pronyense TaxID=1482736 RepID=A0ABS4KFV5_9FIRM|nr:zinc metallopeptidase [Acetoanaerobium pronyense]MBP2026632.1 Zn-dependent membrane protease YugP [Acetoanaerobium pronyense]